jgi:hypothetical protein
MGGGGQRAAFRLNEAQLPPLKPLARQLRVRTESVRAALRLTLREVHRGMEGSRGSAWGSQGELLKGYAVTGDPFEGC